MTAVSPEGRLRLVAAVLHTAAVLYAAGVVGASPSAGGGRAE
jgi:hypothetical protein